MIQPGARKLKNTLRNNQIKNIYLEIHATALTIRRVLSQKSDSLPLTLFQQARIILYRYTVVLTK